MKFKVGQRVYCKHVASTGVVCSIINKADFKDLSLQGPRYEVLFANKFEPVLGKFGQRHSVLEKSLLAVSNES